MGWNEAEKLLEEELDKHYPPRLRFKKFLITAVLTLSVGMTSACGDRNCDVDEVLCAPATSSPADPAVVGTGTGSTKPRYTAPAKTSKSGGSSSSTTQRGGFGKSGGGTSAGG